MNVIENIKLRLLDGVPQYTNVSNNVWKYLVKSIITRNEYSRLELSDIGKYIRIDSSSNQIITIPNLHFQEGASVTFEQVGTGTISIVGDGVTIYGITETTSQYQTIEAYKTSQITWTAITNTNVTSSENTTKEVVTATAGQTIFTFTEAVNNNSLVFINGNYTDNYTITDTNEITFPFELNENDKITKK